MSKIRQLPVKAETSREAPKRIIRPCEWQLVGTVQALETQMGSVEAYNRLCEAAQRLKAKIDAGEGHQQAAIWATDPEWIYPADFGAQS